MIIYYEGYFKNTIVRSVFYVFSPKMAAHPSGFLFLFL